MKDPIVTVTARTAAEPELRFLNTGTAVATVRAVWTHDRRPDNNGDWIKEHETWLTIEWWDKAAEHTADLAIGKGDLVRVTGALFMDEYTRRDGSPGQSLKMKADGTPRVWRKRERDGNGNGQTAPARAPENTPAGGAGHDDPPF